MFEVLGFMIILGCLSAGYFLSWHLYPSLRPTMIMTGIIYAVIFGMAIYANNNPESDTYLVFSQAIPLAEEIIPNIFGLILLIALGVCLILYFVQTYKAYKNKGEDD